MTVIIVRAAKIWNIWISARYTMHDGGKKVMAHAAVATSTAGWI